MTIEFNKLHPWNTGITGSHEEKKCLSKLLPHEGFSFDMQMK